MPKVGTRSLLWGTHQFLLHPLFVLAAWIKLYGFPRDPRVWVCIAIHDLGYWGCGDLDGDEGQDHPLLGAGIAGYLFGLRWADFCLYHSRYMAVRAGTPFSKLCPADKLGVAMMPRWLYLTLANLSGEIGEYLEVARIRTQAGERLSGKRGAPSRLFSQEHCDFHASVTDFLRAWAFEHADMREDTWTPRSNPPSR